MYGCDKKKRSQESLQEFGPELLENGVLLMMMEKACDSGMFGPMRGDQISFWQVKFEVVIKHVSGILVGNWVYELDFRAEN